MQLADACQRAAPTVHARASVIRALTARCARTHGCPASRRGPQQSGRGVLRRPRHVPAHPPRARIAAAKFSYNTHLPRSHQRQRLLQVQERDFKEPRVLPARSQQRSSTMAVSALSERKRHYARRSRARRQRAHRAAGASPTARAAPRPRYSSCSRPISLCRSSSSASGILGAAARVPVQHPRIHVGGLKQSGDTVLRKRRLRRQRAHQCSLLHRHA